MMAEEDNFDIDIYGDDGPDGDYGQEEQTDMRHSEHASAEEGTGSTNVDSSVDKRRDNTFERSEQLAKNLDTSQNSQPPQPAIVSSNGSSMRDVQSPKIHDLTNQTKDGADVRMDHGASSSITISDLGWWVTEDDIRGWANLCHREGDLNEITFSEHKVNGKCKGQAYVEFKSPLAASSVKQKIENLNESQTSSAKKVSVMFSSSATNPFRTQPKDAGKGLNTTANTNSNRGGSGNFGGNGGPGNFNNSFRGGRGGMNSRGNYRNFSGPQMNNGMSNGNSFMANQMGGFGGPMGGGFNNFNRGNMMGGNGMRGGMSNRGNRLAGAMNMVNGMPMGMGGMNSGMYNMGMGGMPGNMNMGMGMGGFGGTQQGHFNPAFFQGQQQQMGGSSSAGGSGDWNPHGAKRPRPE